MTGGQYFVLGILTTLSAEFISVILIGIFGGKKK
jgi:hypothetical protein